MPFQKEILTFKFATKEKPFLQVLFYQEGGQKEREGEKRISNMYGMYEQRKVGV